jgi:hypothetical protein
MPTKYNHFTIVIAACALITMVPQSPAANIPFMETFETNPPSMAGVLGSVDGQNGWTAVPVSNAVVQAAVAQTGDQSLLITNSVVSQTFDGTASNVWVELYVQPSFAGPPANTPSNASAVFWVSSAGSISALDGTTPTTLTDLTFAEGNWIRFVVHIDYGAETWDLWADGTNVLVEFDFYSSGKTGLAQVIIQQQSEGLAYIDDVLIDTTSPGALVADSDSDGMDDTWERGHFNNSLQAADGTTDSDLDGFLDVYEFTADTNPSDDTSLLRVTAVDRQSTTNVVVTFDSVLTRDYVIEASTNLTGAWTGINTGAPLPGAGGQTSFTGAVDVAASAQYYRVQTQRP